MEPLEIPLPEGHARVERVRTGWAVDVDGTATDAATAVGVKAALAAISNAGGGLARLWARGGEAHVVAAARSLGFEAERQLLQVQRRLPLDPPYDLAPGSPYRVTTRAFVPGQDEEAWLAVNNRAFDWHPEQGDMTLADLEEREAAPWFDPAGFLLHEVDGAIVAFCWTKQHLDERPPFGEIYAIAVDPAAGVHGLGKPMVLAGLDHLHRVDGLDWGMLYVDGGNEEARTMYDKLGFTTTRVDESFVREVEPGMTERYGVDRDQLTAILGGLPRYRVDQMWQGLYEQLADPEEMTALPKALRADLAKRLPRSLRLAHESVSDKGDTVKWLWDLQDGRQIETVLMHYTDRSTVCVSSQAGCAMGCGFCATGQAGFDRHLSVGEIVEQVAVAARRARDTKRRLSNVVFMGMGEPLANYDKTWAAVERIHADLGLSARHLTVSTVGIVPGIRRLAAEALPVNLAVSLHAADDDLRNDLVPINKRYPLSVLMDASAGYLQAKGRRLSFEWALIDGVNDRPVDARQLGERARSLPLPAHVNLIPLNPTPGYAVRGTPPDRVRKFRDLLGENGVNATVRRTRGTEIDAACGQLRATHGTPTPVELKTR